MKKRNLITYFFIFFCAAILALVLRGLPGNPNFENLAPKFWEKSGPFESSSERARFALAYSFLENKSLYFSESLARFSTPDLATNSKGQYVSLFAPGVSFLIMPGYILGKYFGLAQFGSYAIIAIFALLNIILIRAIAIKFGADPWAANFGAFAFAFATPAFSYAITLSQHHISTFLMLFGFYLLIGEKKWFSLPLFWFLFALSVVVDNPNLFIILPLAIYAIAKSVSSVKNLGRIIFSVRFMAVLALAGAIIPLGFFFWFNQTSNGNPFKLSGALERILDVGTDGLPAKSDLSVSPDSAVSQKNVVGFFRTRNLLNGFYIHFLSPDRGMINYAPIALLGALGLIYLFRRNVLFGNLILAIVGITILLYSMWGDPYGGWSFGSRYLIPAYALMCLGMALIVSEWKKNVIVLAVVFAIFSYSSWVNTLGAITTNVNPPKIEADAMAKISGHPEKYTYERNEDYLKDIGSKSFVYQTFLKDKMTAKQYYWFVYSLIILAALVLILGLRFSGDGKTHKIRDGKI